MSLSVTELQLIFTMCWRNELNDGDACGVIGDIRGFSDIIGFLGFG